MSKTNCRCGAAANTAKSVEETVAMNVYTNPVADSTACACRDDTGNIARELYRQNRILEQILKTLRVCCGLPPRPGKPEYTTGTFNPEQAGTLHFEAKNLRQCAQKVEAAVYVPTKAAPVSELELEIGPNGSAAGVFPGTFEAGQCIELRVKALSSCLNAAYFGLNGEELYRFGDRDFEPLETAF